MRCFMSIERMRMREKDISFKTIGLFLPDGFPDSWEIPAGPTGFVFTGHTYYEVFWINGRGSFFADFREYPIAGPRLIFVSGEDFRQESESTRVPTGA